MKNFARWLSIVMAVFFSAAAIVVLAAELTITLLDAWQHIKGAAHGDAGVDHVWGLGTAFLYAVLIGLVGAAFSIGVPGSAGQRLVMGIAKRFGGNSGQ